MKDILAVVKLPKATYMYWQKRFDRQNPDVELEAKIKAIRQTDKDFGYRRIWGKLREDGLLVNQTNSLNKKNGNSDGADVQLSGVDNDLPLDFPAVVKFGQLICNGHDREPSVGLDDLSGGRVDEVDQAADH